MKSWVIPRRAPVLLCALALSSTLQAQGAATPAPAQPDSVLSPASADAEFAGWLRAQVTAGRTEAPQLVQSGRFEVLALTPMARASLDRDEVFRSMVTLCKEPMQLGDAEAGDINDLHPWKAFDDAAARVPVFTFSILPSQATMVDCGASVAARHAALARGVRFGRNAAYSASNDALRAELWVNGELVTPALVGRVPVTQVAQSRMQQDGTTQLRLYVAPDRFAPDARGKLPAVELRVWNATDDVPDRIAVPAAVLHQMWRGELRWRAARLANSSAPPVGRPVLPTPRDAALRSALARLDAGDHRAAAMMAEERLGAGDLREADQRTGRLILGLAFDAEGEEAGARIVISDALAAEPCLTFADAVDARYARLLDSARPPARCTSRPLAIVAASSLVPGLGQVSAGRRVGMALAVAGSMAATFAVAQSKHAKARAAFEDYEAVTGWETTPSPGTLIANFHGTAQDERNGANTLMMVSAGIWVLAGVEAIAYEYRHKRGLREVQGYGRTASRVGLTPIPGGIGISVDLFR
jgi:hypothetical protein